MEVSRLRTIKPKIWESAFDYWSMQITAVLLCLHDQKCLATTPEKLLGQGWENWTLASFVGGAGHAVLEMMKASIQNWGAQYLLADYLNVDRGITTSLLDELGRIWKEDSFRKPCDFECYVSGIDSRSGTQFLASCGAKILGDKRRKVASSTDQIGFADLCIIGRIGEKQSLAVFGEVEGNYGDKLLKEDFWVIKDRPLALFGIGLQPTQNEPMTIQVVERAGRKRVVVLLGSGDQLMADFHTAIDVIAKLVLGGPNAKWWTALRLGLTNVVQMVVEYWTRPVIQLVELLRKPGEPNGLIITERDVKTLGPIPMRNVLRSPALPSILLG
jgi:hypothetical protein